MVIWRRKVALSLFFPLHFAAMRMPNRTWQHIYHFHRPILWPLQQYKDLDLLEFLFLIIFWTLWPWLTWIFFHDGEGPQMKWGKKTVGENTQSLLVPNGNRKSKTNYKTFWGWSMISELCLVAILRGETKGCCGLQKERDTCRFVGEVKVITGWQNGLYFPYRWVSVNPNMLDPNS